MKKIVFLLLLLPVAACAQRLVLADRKLLEPVQPADSVQLSDLALGAVPIPTCDIDKIVDYMEQLAHQITAKESVPTSLATTIGDHCTLALRHTPYRASDTYSAVLQVSVDGLTVPFYLVRNTTRKHTVRQLKQFTDYLRNNRLLVSGRRQPPTPADK